MSDDERPWPKWVAWAAVGGFLLGLYAGYKAGGAAGIISVWVGAAGLMMVAVTTYENEIAELKGET